MGKDSGFARFCRAEVSTRNFLPHCMRTLLLMSYDGANVNHSLHRYVRDTPSQSCSLGSMTATS